ncbi:hypothetical protein [Streptomyces sp. NPDC054975]
MTLSARARAAPAKAARAGAPPHVVRPAGTPPGRPFGGHAQAVRSIGMALGIAVLSTLAAARTESLTEAGRPAAEALTSGYHLAFGVGAGLLVAAFAVALTVPRQPKRDRRHGGKRATERVAAPVA